MSIRKPRLDQTIDYHEAVRRKLVMMSLYLVPTNGSGSNLGIRAEITLLCLFAEGEELEFHASAQELVSLDSSGNADDISDALHSLIAEIYSSAEDRDAAVRQMFGTYEYVTIETAWEVYNCLKQYSRAKNETESEPEEFQSTAHLV
jgi:hypothetical protein